MDSLVDPLEVSNAPHHMKRRRWLYDYAYKHCGRFDHLSAHLLGSRLALTHEVQCHGDPMLVEEPGFLESLVYHLQESFGPGC